MLPTLADFAPDGAPRLEAVTRYSATAEGRTQPVFKGITGSVVHFLKNDDGPTAVEYAVMLALIIIVCIVAVTALGTNAGNTFSYVSGQVKVKGS
jgi:pilus assembly protein Flp/PilA